MMCEMVLSVYGVGTGKGHASNFLSYSLIYFISIAYTLMLDLFTFEFISRSSSYPQMTQSEDALFPEDDVGDVAAVPEEGMVDDANDEK